MSSFEFIVISLYTTGRMDG